MKTLLLTDIPPSHSYTAGLVTAQMCRALNPGELVAFVIINKDLQPTPTADLRELQISFALKPNEQAIKSLGGRDFGEFASFLHEARNRYSRTPELIDEAVNFGLKHGVDQVWAILQGQTMVRVSRRVAIKLNVPLKTQIWDPLSWWHQARGVDRINRLLDNIEWKKTLRASRIVASASPAMSEHITRLHGTPSIPVIAAVEKEHSFEPLGGFVSSDNFVIGMAGQFYAAESWVALCDALDKCDWKISGRRVLLKIMGASPPPNQIAAANYEHLGWMEQSDVIRVLSQSCDICYCPYPFGAGMEEVSRLSFPSKIVIYLASGRPILFHGPEYSSPISYISQNGVGLCCTSTRLDDITSALSNFVDPRLYGQFCGAARAAFLRDFTTEQQRSVVREFLSLDNEPASGANQNAKKSYRRIRSSERNRRHLVADAFDSWFYFDKSKQLLSPAQDMLSHYLNFGWKNNCDPNHWFSVKFYLDSNPDVRERNIEPFSHYLEHGWREGRRPNPWFDPTYYLERYHDVRDAGKEPFLHYLRYGQYENRNPTPWFSTKYYRALLGLGGSVRLDPLMHYCIQGWRSGLDPSPWFSAVWYLNRYSEAREQDIEPWLHYATRGSLRSDDPTSWFSVAFYRANNQHVPQDGIGPFVHYLSVGWREGRDPNGFFSTRHYLNSLEHSDLDDFEPCSHYFADGWKQGLDPNEWFSTKYYLSNNSDVVALGREPFSHYLSEGWLNGRDPNDWFSTKFYLACNPDLVSARQEPVTHYLSVGRSLGQPTNARGISFRDRCTTLAEGILINAVNLTQERIREQDSHATRRKALYFELIHSLNGAVHKWLEAVYRESEEERH
ncbi:hypothetical protein ABIE45_003444 [Methylobacterium sp. OAE515]|uniref:hypothetical protein n=1 Tax=Methylobacterium sp. OAE515 TaxID=2817895 RepID=UPI00178BFBED